MNISYISGFFDADGSITMCHNLKNDKFKTIKIDFTNIELELLKSIQSYLFVEHNLKLFISTKPSKRSAHSISYSLSLSSNQKCITLCKLLKSNHPKKLHRINTIIKYHDKVTNRNGKYTEQQITRKLAYERLFSSTNFH
jgi:hypothetical protein